MANNLISINGRIVNEDQALISVRERGFRFGDGVFETCRVFDGMIYNFEAHIERLKCGLDAIKIKARIVDLRDWSHKLIAKNSLKNGLIRIYVSRGIGSIGYLPLKDADPLIVIEAAELPKITALSIKLFLSSVTKVSLKSLNVNYKLAQGLNSTLARMEAIENHCFDGIMFNDLNEICETSSANIFWIKDDILYTPDESCGLLLGTTRQKIIDLSPVKIVKVKAKIEQLLDADEVFITSVALVILSIDQIADKKFTQQKYSKIFTKILNDDIKNYASLARSS